MSNINLKEQLSFKPKIEGAAVPYYTEILVCGMGGSAFPARALTFLDSSLSITLHSDYGAPENIKPNTLAIAISYSGNTKETLSFAEEILKRNISLAIISSGGKLIKLAKEKNLSYVIVPAGLVPRDALLYLLRGLLVILGNQELLDILEKVSIDEDSLVKEGARLSEEFNEQIPLIYSSTDNAPIGYLWKTLVEEFAKIPAFTNVFPELAHNELDGIAAEGKNAGLAKGLRILLIQSENDDKRIEHEMKTFTKLVSSYGVTVTSAAKLPENKAKRLLNGWIMARGFSLALAQHYGVNSPDKTPMIDKLKEEL